MFGQSASATSLHSINEQIRLDPQAKKLYQGYKIKIIGGTIVGSSGVLVLNHSLGSISNRNPHDWGVTSLGGRFGGGRFTHQQRSEKKTCKGATNRSTKKQSEFVAATHRTKAVF